MRSDSARKFDSTICDSLALTGDNPISACDYRQPGKEARPVLPQIGLSAVLNSGASIELFEHLVSAYLTSGVSGYRPKSDSRCRRGGGKQVCGNRHHVRAQAVRRDRLQAADQGKSRPHSRPIWITRGRGRRLSVPGSKRVRRSAARKAGIRVLDFGLPTTARCLSCGRLRSRRR